MIDWNKGRTAWARIAGIGYALIFALAIHANFAVLGGLPGEDDPAAVRGFILDNEASWRLAAFELLVVMAADVVVAYALFRVFAPARMGLNAVSAFFRLVYTTANIPVILLLVGALGWAMKTGAGTDLAAVMASDLAHAYGPGFTLTLGFFGLHLIVLGILILRSRALPRLIGVLVGLAGAGYVLDAVTFLALPGLREAIGGAMPLLVIPPALLGEGALMLWLLFGPVRSPAGD